MNISIIDKIKYNKNLRKAKNDGKISPKTMAELFKNNDFCSIELANFNDVSVFYIFNNDIAIINFIRKTYYYRNTAPELANKNSDKNLAYYTMKYYIDNSYNRNFTDDRSKYILEEKGFGETIVIQTIIASLKVIFEVFKASNSDPYNKTKAFSKFKSSLDEMITFCYNNEEQSLNDNEFFSKQLHHIKGTELYYDYDLDSLIRHTKITPPEIKIGSRVIPIKMEVKNKKIVVYDFNIPTNNQLIYTQIGGKDEWKFNTDKKEIYKFSFKEYLKSKMWFAYIQYTINKIFKTKFDTWYGFYKMSKPSTDVCDIWYNKVTGNKK